ncbi:hypothetical protein BDV27DRAFT_157039 [Aspergillus caelatus]|uniref:Uncharacterized protein n=1 Tax=Aspergillus caelatus TaxID=61420 RepID=A0A5N7A9S3_9EURO|nr:uncharacterized protein BDV27DRAFT_157039 [Aspergillus caelatus]KAE8365340.1 hypothetical protein BDV27DRAFT_157039 [Aspergillus caelatus]
MVEKGDLVPEAYKNKLEHLEALLSEFQTPDYAQRGDTGTRSHQMPELGEDGGNGEGLIRKSEVVGLGPIGGEGLGQVETWDLMNDITASQLMPVASTLDVNEMLDWVGFPVDLPMDESDNPQVCFAVASVYTNEWPRGEHWKISRKQLATTPHYYATTHEAYTVLKGSGTYLLGKSPLDPGADAQRNPVGVKFVARTGDIFLFLSR